MFTLFIVYYKTAAILGGIFPSKRPLFISEQRIEMTSCHPLPCFNPVGKPLERNMLLKLSFVRDFCWMEIPRLDIYLPVVFPRIQQYSCGKH